MPFTVYLASAPRSDGAALSPIPWSIIRLAWGTERITALPALIVVALNFTVTIDDFGSKSLHQTT